MGRLAYLFPTFPVFHQTFVLWEVLGVRRNGLTPTIFSLRRSAERQQPEAGEIAAEVVYLPKLGSAEVWIANWRRLRAQPLEYLGLYVSVFRAWREGATPRQKTAGSGRRLPLRDRLRGWYNRQPYLYLLKSLVLVPHAVDFAARLERNGISHLHVHWATYPTTVAYVAHLASGISYSFSAHAYDIYMVSRMLPAKIRAARFVATCAEANAAFLRGLVDAETGERIHVIYHGVDVTRFSPRRQDASERAGRLRIVSCGQLERYKGFHHLIDACAELERRGVEVDCRIVGEGPWHGLLSRQIADLGLERAVRLTGAMPHAELAGLLAASDAFALASEIGGKSGRRDVIANVLVEAMAAGLPVVATRIPGVEELIEDDVNGLLVRPNHVGDLVAALQRLAGDPAQRIRLGQSARERVLRDFDSSKNVRVLARMLGEAARHDPNPGTSPTPQVSAA